ncbi:hypothetical protein IWQ56_005350 [Coemansia nantahalensis]|nr:hypothetical protein IWQ56_005350 [Coemansia nantahalensis]
MLPFGPTLGTHDQPPQSLGAADVRDEGRLALSSLPLVSSPGMGDSAGFPPAMRPGTFSILNELYEQQGETDG